MVSLESGLMLHINGRDYEYEYDVKDDTLSLSFEKDNYLEEVHIDCFGMHDYIMLHEHHIGYTHPSSPEECLLEFDEIPLRDEWFIDVLKGWVNSNGSFKDSHCITRVEHTFDVHRRF